MKSVDLTTLLDAVDCVRSNHANGGGNWNRGISTG